ncbi:MAG: GntR family transcriptional regulator, partial [Hyphomicrobiales bacterium]
MRKWTEKSPRRTTTDVVFEKLHEEISSLAILPGSKLSEADIAQRFGVSRQPVRDAFNRLEHLDLLLIRPQRATEVRGFSMQRIAHARFVRLAVELEVVQRACAIWDAERAQALDENLQQQQQALSNAQADQFHLLDYYFHKLICDLGD